MFPITTAEAQRRSLAGCSAFRPTHIHYLDDVHRDWGAVRLNMEAVRAFADTIAVSQREALAAHRAELSEFMAKGGLTAGLQVPWCEAFHDSMEFANYENLKIASGFELHLKARLLASDFIVHVLDRDDPAYKALAGEQRDRPLKRSEVQAIQDFHFDGTLNYLPGLTPFSLKFSWLTDRPKYRAALGLSDGDLDIVKDFRALRNELHLPGEGVETPAIHALGSPTIGFLLRFLNAEIIDRSNALIGARGFTLKRIPNFT